MPKLAVMETAEWYEDDMMWNLQMVGIAGRTRQIALL